MTPSPIASLPGRPRARLVPVVVTVLLVMLVVVAGPAALAGRATTALPGSCAAADGVHAGLVVDFGDVDAGSPRPADTADCVADPGANGATLLARRFGKDRIRISSTGLICAIDGYPAEGCGDHLPNGKYRYWSYWKGGSSWTYSQVGPAGRAISDGSVDGWHFVDGSAGPSDGAPGNSPPSGPCAPAAPTTPTVTAPPSSGGGSGASGKPGGQAAPTSLAQGSVGAPSDGSDPATDGTVGVDAAASADGSGASSTGDDTATTGGAADELGRTERASDVGSGGGSAGAPLLAIGVAVAALALGGGAVMRFRSRTDE